VSYAYNVAGDLVTVTAVDATTTYGYDSSHRITSVRDAAGRVTTNVYDGQGRVVSQTEPGSRTTRFAYGVSSTTVTAADGLVTRYTSGATPAPCLAAGVTAADGLRGRTPELNAASCENWIA
jgi:YD repeat-containing protein